MKKVKNDQLSMPGIKQPHGGSRAGAGRPVGTRKKEPTKPIRVPVSLLPEIEKILEEYDKKNKENIEKVKYSK